LKGISVFLSSHDLGSGINHTLWKHTHSKMSADCRSFDLLFFHRAFVVDCSSSFVVISKQFNSIAAH